MNETTNSMEHSFYVDNQITSNDVSGGINGGASFIVKETETINLP